MQRGCCITMAMVSTAGQLPRRIQLIKKRTVAGDLRAGSPIGHGRGRVLGHYSYGCRYEILCSYSASTTIRSFGSKVTFSDLGGLTATP